MGFKCSYAITDRNTCDTCDVNVYMNGANGPPGCLVPVCLRHRIELCCSDCSVEACIVSGSPV
ncbi:unnamed protein product [Schistosoma rodhaini]|uniref:Uncharacterized protein n=2 Tax=Schistosoma rodhaini TaxID=6188 RepID=A0AA85GDL8_9TREM|nr:unnamed protein product [Schistosoma rodhaini]